MATTDPATARRMGEGRGPHRPRCQCFKRVAAPQTLAFAAIELVVAFDRGWIFVSLVFMALGLGVGWMLLVVPIHIACAIATLRDKHAGSMMRPLGQRKRLPKARGAAAVPGLRRVVDP